MKPASAPLIALLATRQFVTCNLYTFTLFGGGVIRITTADVDITFGGNTWSRNPPIDADASRATGNWKIGLDTDTWNVTLLPRQTEPVTGAAYPDKIAGVPWLSAARAGMIDGAQVLVERAYLAAWPQPWQPVVTPTGTLTMFLGRVVEVDVGGPSCGIVINDYRELLTSLMPRNLFLAGCRHTLFDSGCALTAASFAVNGTIGAGSSGNRIYASVAKPAGYFDLGRLVMTGGDNTTFGRAIRSWDGASFTLIAPFTLPLIAGEAFTAYPGCNKQQATCSGKFSNLANFGGMPYIPAAETAV